MPANHVNWFPSFACHSPSNSNQNQIYQNQKTKIKITATKFSSVIHYTKGVSGEYTDILSSECELPLFEAPKHPVWQVGNIWPLRMYTKMLISFYPFIWQPLLSTFLCQSCNILHVLSFLGRSCASLKSVNTSLPASVLSWVQWFYRLSGFFLVQVKKTVFSFLQIMQQRKWLKIYLFKFLICV